MKDERWVVTIYKFDENTMQYSFYATRFINKNEQLLSFIKYMAKDTTKYRYTISYFIKDNDNGV